MPLKQVLRAQAARMEAGPSRDLLAQGAALSSKDNPALDRCIEALLTADLEPEQRLQAAVALGRAAGDQESSDACMRFMSVVTHELRTPLVTMRGYLEMMLRSRLGPINAAQNKGLRTAWRQVLKLDDKIENLLLFSRALRRTMRLTCEPLSVETLVDIAISPLDGSGDRPTELAVSLPEDVWVNVDQDKVARALRILCADAGKQADDVCVSLQVRVEDEVARFEVVDPAPRPAACCGEPLGLRSLSDVEGPILFELMLALELLRAHGAQVFRSSHGTETRTWFELPLCTRPRALQAL